MQTTKRYAIIGLFIGAIVDLLINLVAAAIQQKTFPNQFSNNALWGLFIFTVIGLLVGYWLGVPVKTTTAPSQNSQLHKENTTTITRLAALSSYVKLRGKGIHLSNILSVGSRIDIDTRD